MKTVDEISAKIKELEQGNDDFFGFKRSGLIGYLPFKQAASYLKDDVTSDQWTPRGLCAHEIVAEMFDYMEFAWGKANNCRGISAGRSVQHYEVWLWLLEDKLGEELEALYEFYGKPCLRAICEKYQWDWRKWDDGEWRNDEDGPSISPPETMGERRVAGWN